MINQEILLYIKAQLAAGMSEGMIREMLISRGGWKPDDVAEAFRRIMPPPEPKPMVAQPSPTPVMAARPSVAPTPAPAPQMKPVPPVVQPQPVVMQPAVHSVAAPQPAVAPTVNPAPKVIPVMSVSPQPASPQPAPMPQVAPRPMTPTPAPVQVAPTAPPVATPTPSLRDTVRISQVSTTPSTPIPAATPAPTSVPLSDIKPPTPLPTPTPAATPASSIYAPTRTVAPTQSSSSFLQPEKSVTPEKSPMLVKKSHSKVGLFVVLLLVLVVLGGGGAYAYMTYLNPAPAKAFADAAASFQSAKTGHIKGTIAADLGSVMLAGMSDSSKPATATFDTVFDRTDAANPKTDSTITVGGILPSALSVEIETIGTTLYAKVPDLGFLADFLGGNSQALLPGDWVSFSPSDAATLGQSPIPASGISQAQKDQIAQVFLGGGVITPTVALSRETVNGVFSNHYQFSFNQDAFKNAVMQSYAIVAGNQMPSDQADIFTQTLAQSSVTDGQVWIGVFDKMIHRITFTVKVQGTASTQAQDVKFDISFDSFGKPVSITAPATSKSLLSTLQDAQNKANDARIQSAITSAVPQALIYYSGKRSYVGLCDAPTGLKNILSTMGSVIPYCKSTARAFAVAAPLSTPNQFACADAGQKVVTLASLPTGTVCK
jgi:hypothetical protein